MMWQDLIVAMPILLILLFLAAHFASKLLIAFRSLFCSKFC